MSFLKSSQCITAEEWAFWSYYLTNRVQVVNETANHWLAAHASMDDISTKYYTACFYMKNVKSQKSAYSAVVWHQELLVYVTKFRKHEDDERREPENRFLAPKKLQKAYLRV